LVDEIILYYDASSKKRQKSTRLDYALGEILNALLVRRHIQE